MATEGGPQRMRRGVGRLLLAVGLGTAALWFGSSPAAAADDPRPPAAPTPTPVLGDPLAVVSAAVGDTVLAPVAPLVDAATDPVLETLPEQVLAPVVDAVLDAQDAPLPPALPIPLLPTDPLLADLLLAHPGAVDAAAPGPEHSPSSTVAAGEPAAAVTPIGARVLPLPHAGASSVGAAASVPSGPAAPTGAQPPAGPSTSGCPTPQPLVGAAALLAVAPTTRTPRPSAGRTRRSRPDHAHSRAADRPVVSPD